LFSHITLGTNDWPKARVFYRAVTAALKLPVFMEREEGAVCHSSKDGA
jgi:catechol 2,3-dioxygenase-like lactoylglutathione lyase family enzyme